MKLGTGVIGAGLRFSTLFASAVAAGGPSGGGETITVPAGVKKGDVLVLLDMAFNAGGGGTPATAVPSGFSAIVNDSGATNRVITSRKLAVGTEASTVLTGMNGALVDHKILLVFRGNVAVKSLSVNSIATSGVDPNNPSAQVVASGTGTRPLIVIAAYTGSAAVDPRGMTPAKDGEVSSDASVNNCWLAWKFYNADQSPADVTVDMDDEGTANCLQSFYIELSL